MDATLSYGLPRVNASGTLLEGIALWGELKPLLTQDALVERALQYCDWAIAKGLLAIRTHVDICDDRLLAVEALLHVRARVAPFIDLQARRLPAGRAAACAHRAGQPEARAGQGRGRDRRHPALRTHDGRRRRERAHPLRAGRRAWPARGHALRRERRPAFPPHRDPGLPHATARVAGPRYRLAPDVDALDGQLLRQQAAAADRRSRRARGVQPADQHHPAGPPRQLPEAPRPDARARTDGGRRQRCLRAGLRDGPVVFARQRRHAGGRAHGPARGADDIAITNARVLCGRDRQRREGDGPGRPIRDRSRPQCRPWCCCKRATRSRPSACEPTGCG